jgi:hypothetical protein
MILKPKRKNMLVGGFFFFFCSFFLHYCCEKKKFTFSVSQVQILDINVVKMTV